jgi:MinD-like ATPase involved in chromosome partitioning or flagellar assembly
LSVQAIAIREPEVKSRLVFTQGGKGGTGKSQFCTSLVDWYDHYGHSYTLVDLDTEASKSRGSLIHYFPGKAQKVDVNQPEALDTLLNVLEDGPPVVIADMGAGAGHATYAWFDAMYEGARDLGVAFTAIGLVTPDPASVDSVLKWATALGHRCDYVIVKNAITNPAQFDTWENAPLAERFRQEFRPRIIEMEHRVASVEGPARNYGVTIAKVAARHTDVVELKKAATVIRAQAYRRNLFTEFDRVKDLLLP